MINTFFQHPHLVISSVGYLTLSVEQNVSVYVFVNVYLSACMWRVYQGKINIVLPNEEHEALSLCRGCDLSCGI